MIQNIKIIDLPNSHHSLNITNIHREDGRLTVVYNGFGGAHWTTIENISLDNEEELLLKAYEIRAEILKNKKL